MATGELTVIGDRLTREVFAIDRIGTVLDRLAPHERYRVLTWALAYIGEPDIASHLAARPQVIRRPGSPIDPFDQEPF